MRALVYKLNDGTIVKTMTEAKASGQAYTAQMEEIKTPFKDTPTMARIRKGLFGID
jgi:hypothetical protein